MPNGMHVLRKGDIYMASYTLKLTPADRNLGSEGSLDTSVLNGVSLQRTGYIEVVNSADLQQRMVWEIADGATFNDTFQGLTNIPNGAGGTFII
jgi:hypothetical protein